MVAPETVVQVGVNVEVVIDVAPVADGVEGIVQDVVADAQLLKKEVPHEPGPVAVILK